MFLVGKRAAKFLTRRNSSLYPNATATHRKVSESCGPHGTQPERGSQQLDLAIPAWISRIVSRKSIGEPLRGHAEASRVGV